MAAFENYWKGKVALVTGATGEIGRVICECLADYGINLSICGRVPEALEETADILRAKGIEVITLTGNLENMDFLDQFIDYTVDTFGRIDLLVNNAGMAHKSPIDDITPELFDSIMSVNVRAPYFLCQKALPYLRLSDVPIIFNISSVVAHRGYKNQSVFTVSKHALLGLSRALAIETQEDDIRVYTISPGAVYTDLTELLRPDLKPEELILPSDIADVIAFYLEHRKSSFVIDEVRMRRLHKEPFL